MMKDQRGVWHHTIPDACVGQGPEEKTSVTNRSDYKETNPKDQAATTRLDLSLFPQTAIVYGALGMTEGHCKYGGYNFREKGVNVSVYIAACLRHIFKYYSGARHDAKTNVPHLASALACLAIIIDADECAKLHDTRPPHQDMDRLLERAELTVRHLQATFPHGPDRFTEKAS